MRMSIIREMRGAFGSDTVRPLGILNAEFYCKGLLTHTEFAVVPGLNKSIL